MKECTVICNTRWGYCMTPKKCKSIAEAIRYAKEMEMAFRIFVNGKCIKPYLSSFLTSYDFPSIVNAKLLIPT